MWSKDILAEHDVDIDSFFKAVDALHKIIHIEEQTSANNEKEEQRNIIKEHGGTVVVVSLESIQQVLYRKLCSHLY